MLSQLAHLSPSPKLHFVLEFKFAGMVQDLKEEQRRRRANWQVAFLTFNYDLALDVAFHNNGLQYDYWLSDKPNSQRLPYLKLHGSINWGTCEDCQRIVPWLLSEINFNLWSHPEKIYIDMGSKISQHRHCNKPLISPPLLVPPTWNKTGYHQDLANVWKKAAAELASAENVFVIGYSLPETDSFFRYLYALGSESTTRIKRFWVFNPDKSVEARFRQMIGRGIENRFRFISGDDGKFENAIPIIREELEKA